MSLPRAFALGILQPLLVDPLDFGVPLAEIRPCTCDTQCSYHAPEGPIDYGPPGRRHRCKITDPNGVEPCGECWIQLEPDRIHARPEGLEIVLAEDETDPQAGFIMGSLPGAIMCNPVRLSVDPAPHGMPTPTDLPGTIVVPTGELVDPEPFCRGVGGG